MTPPPAKPGAWVVTLLACGLIGAGCGGASGPRADLGRAVQRVGQVRAGTFGMRLMLTSGRTAPPASVGIALSGQFALDRKRPFPVLNVTYARLAGATRTSATLVSDGSSARLISGRHTIALTGQQRQTLASVLQGPQGLGDLPLHVDRWVRSPRSSSGPVIDGQPTERINGAVSLANASADLEQLSGATGSRSQIHLNGIERRSSLEALVGRRDHVLHRLIVNVDLGPRPGAASTASVGDVVLLLQLRLTPSAGAGVS